MYSFLNFDHLISLRSRPHTTAIFGDFADPCVFQMDADNAQAKSSGRLGLWLLGLHKAIINKSNSERAVPCCTNSVSEVCGWIMAGKRRQQIKYKSHGWET